MSLSSAELADARLSTHIPSIKNPSYDIDTVEALLSECGAALASWESGGHPSLSAAEVLDRRIPSARSFKTGFDAGEVDDLLDRVVMQLRDYESPRSSADEPAPSSSSARLVLIAVGVLVVVGGLVWAGIAAFG